MRLDLGQGWQSLTRHGRSWSVMRVVPGVDRAAGVNRRNRWQLQLYGVDGNLAGRSPRCLFREIPRGKFLESIHQIAERRDGGGNGQTVVYNSRLQNLRT